MRIPYWHRWSDDWKARAMHLVPAGVLLLASVLWGRRGFAVAGVAWVSFVMLVWLRVTGCVALGYSRRRGMRLLVSLALLAYFVWLVGSVGAFRDDSLLVRAASLLGVMVGAAWLLGLVRPPPESP